MRKLLVVTLLLTLFYGTAQAQTPAKQLYSAVLKNNPTEVESLLTGGVDANAAVEMVPGFPTTYLIIAAGQNHLDIAKALIKHKALVNRLGSFKETALMAAAAQGHQEMVAYLLANGADPKATDDEGKDALALAKAGNHTAVVGLLGKKK